MFPINPYIVIGSVSALLISFSIGAYKGYSYEHEKFVAFKSEVRMVAEQQIEKNKTLVKQNELVNKGIKNEYEARINAIRNYYSSGVRHSSSGAVPAIPSATFSIDGKAPDLELNCAYTTQQLVSLQDWIKEQVALQ